MRLPWRTKKRPKAQPLETGAVIPTSAALLRVLTWLAFPEVFEAQVPNPEAREYLRKLAEKSRHATSTAEALMTLANELSVRLSPEILRRMAGGLGE